MTAPTVNGVRYPQPIDELLPSARALAAELGDIPSRNRLMRELRVGAPKADELRARLAAERDRQAETDALHRHLAVRGSVAERPVLYPVAVDQDAAPAAPLASVPLGPDPLPTPDVPRSASTAGPDSTTPPTGSAAGVLPQRTAVGHPDTNITTTPPLPASPRRRPVRTWPLVLLALPAFVAVWSGWVGLGELTGFGMVHPLPGIADSFALNSAITLPVGVETYAAFALRVWLSPLVPGPARKFARWSAIGSLTLGALGQVAYHTLSAAGMAHAPWWITTIVATLPVAVLGMGAALAHLLHATDD